MLCSTKYLSMVLKMALKDVIRDARLKKSLKQEDVAKLLGITVQTYSKWENGKTEPKASQIAKLSGILGISTNTICNGRQSQKLELIDFIKISSKISPNLSDFEQTTAIWENIDDDYKYLNSLKDYAGIPDEYLTIDGINLKIIEHGKTSDVLPSSVSE